MAPRSPVSAAHRLLSLDIVLALLALAGGLRVLYLAAPAPALPAEAATVAHVHALAHLTSFADAGGAGVSPFGWLQLAAATMVSDAFGRSATALAAVRETVLLAAVAGAVLLWVLARRLGLTRWASTAAVLLLAASPLALGVQRLVVVEHLAALWVLGALVLITRPRARIRHDIVAAVCLLAAVLTSPLALFFLPAAGWLLARRAPARAALVAVLLNLGLGIAFGPAAALLRPHLAAAGRPSAADWAALDPAWIVLSAVALVAALGVRAVRPFAVSGLLLAAALLVPGVPDTAVFALLVPVTPLLVAGIAQAAGRRWWPGGFGDAGRRARFAWGDRSRSFSSVRSGGTGGRLARAASADVAPPPPPQPVAAHREDHRGGSAWEGRPPQPTPARQWITGRLARAPQAATPQPTPARRGFRPPQAEVTPTAAPPPTTAHRADQGHLTQASTVAHHGRPPRRHRLLLALAGVTLAATVAVSWGFGYPALQPAADRGGPLAAAREWLRANASGSRLLVDEAAWAELANTGWPTGLLAAPAACAVTCPAAEWAVFGTGETGLRKRFPALDAAFTGAGATAVFGDGDIRVTVWRLGLPPADPAAPPETPARAHAGAALTASARITLTPEAAAVLQEGCADPRLIATIAALAAVQPVRVAAFPEVAGEDAARQPRRRVLLTGGETGVTAFYTGQRDLFRPASVVRTADGVLVTYPLFAPPGLLVPYSSP
ncbi:glycosyl transferase [Amycolatopsis sp. A133]|uniref:glycosyl transferase n=1 Tax=Amycolatopsis sp. A133 TaxID=3064472 RepID=UPI0027F4554D|nr:glycosyl transferase [Amycolatopsis sp. A133]MDQ7806492.1 glycosyl transferase [Amycolatopsis sp. A133]